MSSKGRGEKLDPSGLDNYPTPAWCVHRLLEQWTPRRGVWVEPCAGEGALVRAVNACLPGEPSFRWDTYEVNPEHREQLRSIYRPSIPEVYGSCYPIDFLTETNVNSAVKAVITNPPFVLLTRFIEHCRHLYPEAEVVMLLRAGVLESDERVEFWKRVGVPDLFPLRNRPSFRNAASGALKTDSTLYSWFLWPPASEGTREEGRVRLLNPTSLEDRQQWR